MNRFKVDLHIHTKHSSDGRIEPEKLVSRADELGFDVIGVTDHMTTRGAIDAERIARRKAGRPLVVIGQEVKTVQGEILVYGIRKDMEEGQDLADVCKKTKRMGGFVIVPHPFDIMRRGIGKNIETIADCVDAAESFNARTLINAFNNRAADFLKRTGIPAVVGSDSHFIEEFGKTYMLVRCERKEDFLSAIKGSRTEFFTHGPGMISGLKRGLRKAGTYF
jgi:predicted metal-dependent phosphoesterase TrpH